MSETNGLHVNGIAPIIRRNLPRCSSLSPSHKGVLGA